MPRNPLVRESVIGLLHPGPVQLAYLNYLVVQAVVLLVWWPKSELYRMVLRSDPPSTLLAVVIAVGITTAYHALRLGAEEVMAEGQQSLREWAVSTGLAPGRIVGGYLTGHLLQTLQMLVLSAPLLLAAFGICAADWNALGWSIALIAVQLTMWRLLAAVVYLGVGHHGTATYLGLRALLIAAYAGLGAVLPGASHIVVSFRLLDPSRDWSTAGSLVRAVLTAGDTLAAHHVFLALHGAVTVVLVVVLRALLARARRGARPAAPPRGGGGDRMSGSRPIA